MIIKVIMFMIMYVCIEDLSCNKLFIIVLIYIKMENIYINYEYYHSN